MRTSKRYAGEGRTVHEAGQTILTRPLRSLKRLLLRLVGKKQDDSTFNRDFYAAITSDQNYVILGEARYGMSSRIASLKKAKPNPPKKKTAA